MNSINLQKAIENINVPADWVGIRQVKETTTYRVIRDGNPEQNSIDLDQGIMVEVLVNGQFGYYGTHKSDYESINTAAKKAYDIALNSSKYSNYLYTDSVRPKAEGVYNSPYKIKNLDLHQLTDLLIKSNKILKGSDKIVTAMSMARIVDMNMKYASSNGSNLEQNFLYVGPGFRAIAQDGNTIQSRSYTDQCQQTGMEMFDEDFVINKCESICKEAVELLNAEECPSESMDLVLHSDQMLLQIHESIGNA